MKEKKWYYWDINYRLKTSSTFVVLARTKKEAREEAEKYLNNMSKEELAERYFAALTFSPDFAISSVEILEECDDEDEKEFFNIKEGHNNDAE